eukprot:gene23069-30261_t
MLSHGKKAKVKTSTADGKRRALIPGPPAKLACILMRSGAHVVCMGEDLHQTMNLAGARVDKETDLHQVQRGVQRGWQVGNMLEVGLQNFAIWWQRPKEPVVASSTHLRGLGACPVTANDIHYT